MSHSAYEWVRNFHGLMPLRVSCWKHCWMSDAAWTEWKNYSRTRFNYVAWLPGNSQLSDTTSRIAGMRLLCVNVLQLSEMSIQALKNVRQLSISKSLTCDALSVSLTSKPDSVKKPSRQSVYGYAGSEKYGRTFWPSSEPFNGSQLSTGEPFVPCLALMWDDENSNPMQDVRDFLQRRRDNPERFNPIQEPDPLYWYQEQP